MKKFFWIFGLILLLFICFAIWAFSNPSVTDVCSDTIIECIEQSLPDGRWPRFYGALKCVFSNVICVFSNVKEGF